MDVRYIGTALSARFEWGLIVNLLHLWFLGHRKLLDSHPQIEEFLFVRVRLQSLVFLTKCLPTVVYSIIFELLLVVYLLL